MLGSGNPGFVSFGHLASSRAQRVAGAIRFPADEHGDLEFAGDNPLPEFTQERNRSVATPSRDDGVGSPTSDPVGDCCSRIRMPMDAADNADGLDCRGSNSGVGQRIDRGAGHQVDGVDRVIDIRRRVDHLGSTDDDRGTGIDRAAIGHEA